MIFLKRPIRLLVCFVILLLGQYNKSLAQCGGIMEPGFAFLTSSRGCAPFTVNLQTIYLSSVAGTQYFVDWGDGTPEQTYIQGALPATGVTMVHNYPLASVNCGYDVVIDASNGCNPRGSVVPITTQVIVWTNDVVSVSPAVFRVCAGAAADVLFTDNSAWNCFPRATRENNAPRWIQWIYGTGAPGIQIPGTMVNTVTPGGFPYLDPAANRNPRYPVAAPGQVSLPINVPATLPADIGKEFEVTLKNWNQCNPYDNNLLDGDPKNPVNGDIINGDNPPQIATARVVIVDAPQPAYVTRLGNAGGPIQSVFCISDNIYFDNNTPPIAGASFLNTWEFFDNNTGIGVPLATTNNVNPTFTYITAGQKLIRLSVQDQNAAGNCVSVFDALITISPSLIAKIQTSDFSNNPITPDFCQNAIAPFNTFQVRLSDVSVGTATATTEWKWEFYDENNVLVQQAPVGGGFSTVPLGPFDRLYSNRVIYKTVLIIRDNVTSCQTTDQILVRVFENPVPQFNATRVCQGQATTFAEASTLNSINGESIVLREWDFNYDGVMFNKDPAFDNLTSFNRPLGPGGTYQVALRTKANQRACSAIVVVPVIVDPLPNATFTPDITSGCSVLRVTFTNNSVLGQPDVIDRFEWEINSGAGFMVAATQRPTDPGFTNQFINNFVNTGAANKIFNVRLRVVTVNNCASVSGVTPITVFPGTTSGFISTNYSPFNDNCSPISVNFSVDPQTQSMGPTNYQWQISDINGVVSDVSTGTTPSYTGNFVNNTPLIKDFNVRLITTLPSGCFGDSTRIIRVSPVPNSIFNIDTAIFDCQRMRLKFVALQKGLQYHWIITENTIMMLNTVGASDVLEYEVSRGGVDINLGISLDTKNIANCPGNVTTQSIVAPKKDAINTSFTASPAAQTLPSSTVFITNTTNTGPWTYAWDFGDGSTSTSPGPTLQHTYVTYGTYTVKLTVKNNVCVEERIQTIVINGIPPIVDFSYDPASGCQPLSVKFKNLSRYADASTYVWNFGDGQATSRAIDPTYTYFQPGKYTVSLSASNVTGQVVTEVKQNIIEVFVKPSAQFETKPRLIYIPGGILYTKNNSFDAGRFLWDFGDGGTSDLPEPQHSYQAEGAYTITMIAISPNNCTDTARVKNAALVQKGGQVLVPNAFSPNLNGQAASGPGFSDGKNDVFLPLTRGVVQFEMLVFNRWGELLFQSTEAQHGWDGYYQGKLCPQDVYVYKISAMYDNGERVVRTGDINLIR